MSSQQSKEKRNQLENIDRDFAIGLAAPSDQQNRMPDRPLSRSLLLGINLGLHDTGGLGGGGGGGTGSGSLIEAFTEWYENLTTEDIDPITAGLQTVAVPPDADGVGGDTAPVILIKGLAYELDQWSSSIIEGFLEWWENVTDEPFNTMREIGDLVWIEAKKVLDWYKNLVPDIADADDSVAVKIIKGLIATGTDWVNGVKDAIEDGIVAIVDLIKPKLVEAYDILEETAEDIVTATQTALEATYTWLKEGAEATVAALQDGLEATYDWLKVGADATVAALQGAFEATYDWLEVGITTVANNVWTSLKSSYTWLKNSAAGVVTALGDALGDAYTFLGTAASAALDWVADLNLAARNAIDEAGVWVGNAAVKVKEAVDNAYDWITTTATGVGLAAMNWVKGLTSTVTTAIDNAGTWVSDVTNKIKEELIPIFTNLGNQFEAGLIAAGQTVLEGAGGVFGFFQDLFVTIFHGEDGLGDTTDDAASNIDLKNADLKNVDRIFFGSDQTDPEVVSPTKPLISGHDNEMFFVTPLLKSFRFIIDDDPVLDIHNNNILGKFINFNESYLTGIGSGTISRLGELSEASLDEDADYLMILDGSINTFRKIKASALGGGGGSTFNPLEVSDNLLPASDDMYRLGASNNFWSQIYGKKLYVDDFISLSSYSGNPSASGSIWLDGSHIKARSGSNTVSLSDIGGGSGTITVNDLPSSIPFSKMQALSTRKIAYANNSGVISSNFAPSFDSVNIALADYPVVGNITSVHTRLTALENA